MLITKRSMMTGQKHSMSLDVTENQLNAWHSGGMIQEVMPHLTAGEREFLMTGITPSEWAQQYGHGDI
jgi:hypothetical protein